MNYVDRYSGFEPGWNVDPRNWAFGVAWSAGWAILYIGPFVYWWEAE